MPRNSNRKGPRGTRRGGRQRGPGRAMLSHPPQFKPTVGFSHKFRFASGTNAGTTAITRAQLLNLIQVATSAVTTVRVFQAVRLKKVEMWTNPPVLGSTPVTCSCEWIGENSPSTVHSDTSMGVQPAHVLSRPPASSSNRWWSLSGQQETDNLIVLIFPADTIIDVSVQVRMVEQENPTAGDVPAGASLGKLYGNYLDGIVSGLLLPIGYTFLP
jgi:hypothetical protein